MGGNARGYRPAGFKGGASAGFLNEIIIITMDSGSKSKAFRINSMTRRFAGIVISFVGGEAHR